MKRSSAGILIIVLALAAFVGPAALATPGADCDITGTDAPNARDSVDGDSTISLDPVPPEGGGTPVAFHRECTANAGNDTPASSADEDWYGVNFVQGQRLTVEAALLPSETYSGNGLAVHVYSPPATDTEIECPALGAPSAACTISVSETGLWRIGVKALDTTGTYAMNVSATQPQEDPIPSNPGGDCGLASNDAPNARADVAAGSTISLDPVPDTGAPALLHKECQATAGNDTPASSEDQDWYGLSLVRGQRLTVTTTLPPSDAYNGNGLLLHVYTPAETDTEADCPAQSSLSNACTIRVLESGLWRIGVQALTTTGTYAMNVSATPPQEDCGVGGDAAEGISDASTLSLASDGVGSGGSVSAECTAGFGVEDSLDYYAFEATQTQMLSASITGDPALPGLSAELLKPDGSSLAKAKATTAGGSLEVPAIATDQTGTHYLVVKAPPNNINTVLMDDVAVGDKTNQGVGGYSFHVSVTENDGCGATNDAGNTFATATAIALTNSTNFGTAADTSCDGTLAPGYADGEDWYQITVGRAAKITLDVTAGAGMALGAVELQNQAGAVVETANSAGHLDHRVGDTSDGGPPADGTSQDWRIKITGSSAAAWHIHLVVSDRDNDSAGDVSDSEVAARSADVSSGSATVSGAIFASSAQTDSVDWYRLGASGETLRAATVLSATIEAKSGSNGFAMCVKDFGTGSVETCATGTTTKKSLAVRLTGAANPAMRVSGVGSGTGTYQVTISAFFPNDCGLGADAGDTSDAAWDLGHPSTMTCDPRAPGGRPTGNLDKDLDRNDFYKWRTESATQVSVSMQPVNADGSPNTEASFAICLYQPGGLADCHAPGPGLVSARYAVGGTGDWRIEVRYLAGKSSDYRLVLQTKSV